MIRFDTMTGKIAIDTEVWSGGGKITITRGPNGVSIRYGESAAGCPSAGTEGEKGAASWYRRQVLARLMPNSVL